MFAKKPMENVRNLKLTSGFSYPSRRDDFTAKTSDEWIKGYVDDGGCAPYWRIHDKLYDLEPFIGKHPGGNFYLEITKGADITELFESNHFSELPEVMLSNFFVKNANTPRKSPFTFEENGFFKTLKRKVMRQMEGVVNEPSFHMLLIQDGLFFSYIILLIISATIKSYLCIILAGILQCLATVVSHNFFHQKDNWRMYIFDFGLLSSRDWRITHNISHHMFPNTIYDFEISVFEPFFEFLPTKKTLMHDMSLFTKSLHCIIVLLCSSYVAYFKRLYMCILGMQPIEWTLLLQPIQYMVLYSRNGSFYDSFTLYLAMQTTANVLFILIGLSGAHHAQNCYTEGDKALPDKDWGLHQIAATCDRSETSSSLFLGSISFGNHTLHHLFPSIDYSLLPGLSQLFQETCEQFNIDTTPMKSLKMLQGSWEKLSNHQVATNYPLKFKFS